MQQRFEAAACIALTARKLEAMDAGGQLINPFRSLGFCDPRHRMMPPALPVSLHTSVSKSRNPLEDMPRGLFLW